MLSAVSGGYDPHNSRRNSIRALTASLDDGKTHLLLACSGSVATIKLPNIIQALSKYPSSQLSVRVVLTPSASRFLAGQSKEQPTISGISSLPNVDAYVIFFLYSQGKCGMKIAIVGRHTHLWQYIDADEWKVPWVRGAGILHIELRRWADVLVIAPLSANTLAKIVGGFSDSLLTSVVRAWDPWGELDASPAPVETASTADKTDPATQETATVIPMTQDGIDGATRNRRLRKRRIIVAPAMNTAMWRHPITAKQLRVLEEEWGVQGTPDPAQPNDGSAPGNPATLQENGASQDEGDGWFEVLRPQSKVLACGDAGDGAMLEWSQIVTVIEQRLELGAQ
ncbi:putative flavoprotein [Xylaria acuta]|nr:putative flavoprotein [Xylaria acuta]